MTSKYIQDLLDRANDLISNHLSTPQALLVEELVDVIEDLIEEWYDMEDAPQFEWILIHTSEGRVVPASYVFDKTPFWATGIGPNLSDPETPCEFLPVKALRWRPLPIV